MEEKVSAREFEEQVFDREGIRVILRCAPDTLVPAYPYERRIQASATLNDLKENRLSKTLGAEVPYSLVLGDGNSNPHGNMKASNARGRYLD
ncbi:hypothetical protein SAMN02745903_00190 [Pseudomonas sp. URMO17WK12:I5]|nr:hypothetical protein H040_00190 [Pseudomonas sp. URMO17WK12:I7]SME90896.1 hypothetical protein SAMN02745903_00190 [Pseudomonas sp. URMO17WK12:I5]